MSTDIQETVDAALAAGLPARIRLPDKAAALAWRHRFYRWRQKAYSIVYKDLEITGTDESNVWLLRPRPVVTIETLAGDTITNEPLQLSDLDLNSLRINIERE